MNRLSIDQISIRPRSFPLAAPRSISRETSTDAELIEVIATGAGVTGIGQAGPTPHWGESVARALADFAAIEPGLLKLTNREDLQRALPPGALRNAIDCALWDLEAKQTGQSVETIAGVEIGTVTTVFTIPLNIPEVMGAQASSESSRPVIKIKLGHYADDAERLRAVRAGAPSAKLVVDANEGWNLDQLIAMAPVIAETGVALIEQPLPVRDDEALRGLAFPAPLCADEACHVRADLPRLEGLYDLINIKLDKTGGLTEALALARDAKARGFGLMVGCTWGTTLGMAPAFLIAQACEISDLDAPLFLADQERDQLSYDGSSITFSTGRTWGL